MACKINKWRKKKVELEIHKYPSWLEVDQLAIYEPRTT